MRDLLRLELDVKCQQASIGLQYFTYITSGYQKYMVFLQGLRDVHQITYLAQMAYFLLQNTGVIFKMDRVLQRTGIRVKDG